MVRIVLYARAQAPGPSGLSSWNARVRGGSTALSGLTAIRLESATSQVRFAFALWWRAVNASCVSLRLDCTGWGSTGRVGLDRKNNVTPHSAGRARALGAVTRESSASTCRVAGALSSPGPVRSRVGACSCWPRMRSIVASIIRFPDLAGSSRIPNQAPKTKENCRARAPQGDHRQSVQPCALPKH